MASQLTRKSETLHSQISRIPNDLLIEVLAKVAAYSYTNLVQAKLVTKDFLEASNHRYIFRHVSLGNFKKLLWKNRPEFWSFMENCNNNENPESLYRTGMLEFFTHCREASGLTYLKLSAQKGYVDACYVYGIVMHAANLQDEGLIFLKHCEIKLGYKMVECRRRVKEFVQYFWVKNKISCSKKDVGDRRYCSNVRNNCMINEKRNGWDWNDEDDYYGEHACEDCKWNCEVLRFCNMLRTGGYS